MNGQNTQATIKNVTNKVTSCSIDYYTDTEQDNEVIVDNKNYYWDEHIDPVSNMSSIDYNNHTQVEYQFS